MLRRSDMGNFQTPEISELTRFAQRLGDAANLRLRFNHFRNDRLFFCPNNCRWNEKCDADAGKKSKCRRLRITLVAPINVSAARTLQPRAIGSAQVSVYGDATGCTRLRGLRQSGSLKLVFPQTHRKDAEAILVNTAGGITGGDRFKLDIDVSDGARLTLSTQAAERAYRAQAGEVGSVKTKLRVEDGGCLHWLPQELILYDRCALRRRLDISLGAKARLLMVEPVVFGRAAMPEILSDISFQDRIKITQEGKPVYIDGMDLQGDAAAHLDRPALANGAGAMASVVMVAPDAEARLSGLRALLPATAGASLLCDGVLVVRHLAPDSFELRRALIPMLEHLSNHTLPASWRL